MGSFAQTAATLGEPPAALDAVAAALPELSTEDYYREVLKVAGYEQQLSAEKALISRARELGIDVPDPISMPPDHRDSERADSQNSTLTTSHARTFSSSSYDSASTDLTSSPSTAADATDSDASSQHARPRSSRDLGFSHYDKYLASLEPTLNQPRFFRSYRKESADSSTQSVFSVGSRYSYISIKEGLRKMRWRRRTGGLERPHACICCRDDFQKSSALHCLPCGHTYCGECLRFMIQQATTDESKFPPRCCTQPIPSSIIKSVVNRQEKLAFLKAVRQFSTPWEARVYCPNAACSEFIPPRTKLDPKHPADVVCKKCRTRVCLMCKRNAHAIGKDCPDDHELNEVLKIGEKSGWKRCYKCRALVELSHGCTHMTCRCKAQFCYLCGAIWNPAVGCPNFCDGDEELERRRIEEEERAAADEAEKAAEEAAAAAAVERFQGHPKFIALRAEMIEQKQCFGDFLARKRWLMEVRHSERKGALMEKYAEQVDKMEERHSKTAFHLDERQVEAEMELRTTLQQSEKSVLIRLKHMEAYCDRLGHNPESDLPARVVTERDLRELGQQYNVRDNMARLHQARINVLRDRQTKRMEELMDRQTKEMEKLLEKRQRDLENLAMDFALEEDEVARVFDVRKRETRRYWCLKFAILRRELEEKDGVRYAQPDRPVWSDESAGMADTLDTAAAPEEDGC
ncbi:IBR domain-containing protein [Plectosphaerella cucumerina]|uniref:RBR-type E3 ubiquitin transferase n=1 Tax=Plectosphaerella cucumerina TaxID=40658 RepID=A0A8K0X1M3_9PEZI|nr:IBR domain-containing protein [Plectosphaerella cucumerina]